jgi:hypothetical protein
VTGAEPDRKVSVPPPVPPLALRAFDPTPCRPPGKPQKSWAGGGTASERCGGPLDRPWPLRHRRLVGAHGALALRELAVSAGCRSSCSSLRSASFARSLTWCSLERPRSTAVEPARPESRRIPMGQGRAIIRVSIGDTGGWREYGIGAHRASVGIGGTTMKCKG